VHVNVDLKRKLVAGVVVAIALAGGSVAIASTQFGSPQQESEAIVKDAANQLGIEPTRLSNALKQALKNRVDAAVGAGRITKEEGEALKERIDSGELPFFFGGPGFRHGHFAHFGDLEVAADYLELGEVELRTQLKSGKSLAQIARDRDKSVDGLVDAIVDAAKEKLDDAVEAGRLSDERRDAIVEDLPDRVRDLVNRTPRDRSEFRFEFRGPRGGFGFGFRGPPISELPLTGPTA
jgi:hypothetical protein